MGEGKQLSLQLVGVGSGLALAAVGTCLLGLLLKYTMGLRVPDTTERDGLDVRLHGERGYHFDIAS